MTFDEPDDLPAPPPMSTLGEDAVELARELIRIDTSNPPGNETRAAVVLRDWLGARGVDAELIGPDPDRQNLVATVPGRGAGPSIALCGHLDVVPAPDPHEWTHPPFGGDLVDGALWGRGAVDMKAQVATRAAALAAFVQSGARPAGTVRLISQADEEVNRSDVGMSWLVRERADLRTDWALEEGGGRHMRLTDGRDIVLYGVADKALSPMRIEAHGAGGHAATPGSVVNPVSVVARAVSAMAAATPHRVLVPAARRMLDGLLGDERATALDPSDHDARIAAACSLAPELANVIDAITRTTFTPTGLVGSDSINVIPSTAAALIDCRALPGQSAADVVAQLEAMLRVVMPAGDAWQVEHSGHAVGGSASEVDAAFTSACARALAAGGTTAQLVPSMNPFYTDAHSLRSVWGTTTYGFWPYRYTPPADYAAGVHAADERLLAADVQYAAQWHLDLLLDLASS